MDETANPSVEALLAHAGWVRALARTLVLDPNDADDLAQETMAVALSARPRPGRGFSTWLATTLRNVRLQRWRREHARERIERAVGREVHQPSTDELAEQADLQRALVAHVLALDEPYRGVVLQRWFAGLEAAEIAVRENVPLGTVTSRLARAHEKLRERLERNHGGGDAWLSALIPLIGRPPALSTVTVGGALLNAKIVLSVASVVLVAGVLVWMSSTHAVSPDGALVAKGTEQPVAEPRGRSAEAIAADAGAKPARESLAHASSPSAPPEAAVPAEPVSVRGRVLDSDGHPLSGVTLGWTGTREGHVASGAQGWFELSTTAARGTIDVFDATWTAVRAGSWRENSKIPPVLIVARAIDCSGTVQDPDGRPLAGARVELGPPLGFGARFEGNLEATVTLGWRAMSDANGRFSFARVPVIAGATLRVVLEGYTEAEIDEPVARDDALVIVLQRPTVPLVGALRGRVVDERGSPVPTARVFLGLASTTTDDAGAFGITLARAVTSDHITATKPGYRSAVLARPRPPHGDETGWPDVVELQLPGPALSMRGIVLDHEKKPRAGIRVWLADPTPVGAIGKMPTFAENLMAGATIPPLALQSESRLPKTDGDSFSDFYLHMKQPNAFWHFVQTDEAGRFELTGLDDRRYRLRLLDDTSMEVVTTDEFQAGDDAVRIVMPPPDLLPRVAGRVRDDDGKAVPGVLIRLDGEPVSVRSRVFGGRVYMSARESRETVKTDAEGRFEFKDVPREGIQLLLEAEQIIPGEIQLSAQKDPAAIDVTVHTRCSFQVQITSKDLVADAVAVLDADGRPLDIFVLESGSVNAFTDTPIVDGRTAVVAASSAAATLVLLRDDEVVKRAPIRLRSDEINRIDL